MFPKLSRFRAALKVTTVVNFDANGICSTPSLEQTSPLWNSTFVQTTSRCGFRPHESQAHLYFDPISGLHAHTGGPFLILDQLPRRCPRSYRHQLRLDTLAVSAAYHSSFQTGSRIRRDDLTVLTGLREALTPQEE